MTGLNLQHVFKRFDQHAVLHDVNIDITPGEFVVFVGPSGCGKSTLLRMIAGLETISDGDLVIGGNVMNDVPAAQRGIAMVFQSYALYPHMNVYKNMAFALETARMPKAEIDRRVRQAAEVLQLGHLLERKPKQLSGGQRQRVAIGRAIVREPGIFLFDEPLSNLDAELRVQMRVEIANLHRKLGNTMIYVTHDQVEAMTMADKIVVLRAGKVEQIGSPLDLYNNPANRFVAGFIGSPKMNFLSVAPAPGGEGVILGGQEVRLPGLRPPAEEGLVLGIRPEHLRAGSDGVQLGGLRVQLVEQLGSASLVYGQTADGQAVTLQLEGQRRIHPGENIPITCDAGDCHLFRADGSVCPRLTPVLSMGSEYVA
ncbi:MAG: sn-glycerol-3-phosphate ABC transporter ATP-binding protein UgpC [Azospirillum brasilense]|uniref:Sn-glycerol-3-phosphate ABC transporter ATP-binding protein UgpC n=1 Tax=Roseomonas gilardii TaxID=257708 RepID=A0A1L7AHK7_9PROT|nr:sn-glycerol-3-phosphate ABC transporter ATP-binding protein UgpC [Roseomonas gilardii]APT58273.1 sugar ABC transporter ATP-binding protein [Roseomonas gilardii]MDT8330882.1 sn-glycerol-3-phosphate ABC transporter ATP-binding protein UgpC [Roseomonas gilardii]PZP46403.1 MAG: sn-glycerol-3-phosphate ABC transporter ATP-binding protein UgpC [Azospirillum brasilense]PZR11619.1 MAG: sn-glycerol-3-phosphate ABC transporter ATP-binding protein UgpC [Azospirillum brasilense]